MKTKEILSLILLPGFIASTALAQNYPERIVTSSGNRTIHKGEAKISSQIRAVELCNLPFAPAKGILQMSDYTLTQNSATFPNCRPGHPYCDPNDPDNGYHEAIFWQATADFRCL